MSPTIFMLSELGCRVFALFNPDYELQFVITGRISEIRALFSISGASLIMYTNGGPSSTKLFLPVVR